MSKVLPYWTYIHSDDRASTTQTKHHVWPVAKNGRNWGEMVKQAEHYGCKEMSDKTTSNNEWRREWPPSESLISNTSVRKARAC